VTVQFWICALVTLLSAAISAGFSLAGLAGPDRGDRYARYGASRSVALLLTVLIAIVVRSSPATPMVAEFLGQVNWLKGQVTQPGTIETPIGTIGIDTKGLSGAVQIGIRPSSIELSAAASSAPNEFAGEIIEEIFLGEQIQLKIRLAEGVVFEVRAQKPHRGRHHARNVFCRMDVDEMLVYGAH